MLNTQTPPPKQVLLRLPDDVAAKLARAVPPRQRNRFLVHVLVQALAKKQEADDRMLIEAAKQMNALEIQYPELRQEAQEWEAAPLTDPVDVWDADFDREAFERDWAEAQAAKASAARKPKA